MHTSHVSRRRFLSLSGLAAAAAATGGFRPPLAQACPNPEDIGPAARLANGINTFASEMYAALSRENRGNLFFSPFSMETALAMTAAGARGDTLKEMEKVLRLPEEPHAAFRDLIAQVNGTNGPWGLPSRAKRAYELSSANALWGATGYPWRKEFLDLTRKHYGAGLVETNFGDGEASRKLINGWVEKETRNKIKDLIARGVLTIDTRLVLTNAIYFKGDWQVKFDKKDTKDEPFTHAGGAKADVPMMNLTSKFNYGEMTIKEIEEPKVLPSDPPKILPRWRSRDVKVQVLEMPYAGRQLSMLIYLPERASAIDRLAGWLSAEELGTRELKPRQVKVSLPRFKTESNLSLQPVLQSMGMRRAFSGADFSGMHTSDEHLYISHVLHKAFVDVNEEGSEAAAATAVVVVRESSSAKPELVEFRADRPFVFAIRENKTGTALFLGRYSGPRA
jgi:serpin B